MSAAAFAYRQFHNQPPGSPLHRHLRALWAEVSAETGGRLDVTVCPANAGVAGGDPEALQMLVAGEVEFYTVMGGLLGAVAPEAEITGLPFAFVDETRAWATMDGPLGAHVARALAARGIHAIPGGCFDNGLRHVTTSTRPIRDVADFAGLAIRIPAGRLFADFFATLGARPVSINLNRLHAALAAGDVEAQENPLGMVEVNRLYEVQTRLCFTGHMWSGFNLVASAGPWRALPADVRAVVEAAAPRHVARQRAESAAWNAGLATALVSRGMVPTRTDTTGMRAPLGPLYARWRRELGTAAWRLLEAHTGPLG